MKKKSHIVFTVVMCIILAFPSTIFTKNSIARASSVVTSTNLSVLGTVTATNLNVRTKASTSSAQLNISGKKVSLKNKTKVTIIKEVITDNKEWYYVSFKWGSTTKYGYVLSEYVKLTLSSKVPVVVYSKTNIKIRTDAGNTKPYLQVDKKTISIGNRTNLTITSEVTKNGEKWFKTTFTYAKKTRIGYIKAIDVFFKEKVVDVEVPKDDDATKVPEENPNSNQENPTDDTGDIKTGVVIGDKLRVRTGMGINFTPVYDTNNNLVYLYSGHKLTIISESLKGSTTWYQVTFVYGETTLTGFVSGDYVKIVEEPDTPDVPTTPVIPTIPPTPDPPVNGDPSSNVGTTPILNNVEFEASLSSQGFPESYKPYLRSLHAAYPYWKFEAFQTGLDWNTVIINQNRIGKNLITNSKDIAWKSLEVGSYNWKTDKFIPYDGSYWVTASKAAIEYYMDPRNFLTDNGIFQFELLSYQPAYQTKVGVENILQKTALYNKTYTYKDDLTGIDLITTYSDTFIKAAENSLVSPYHLATRVKQEIVTGSTTLSSSVSGMVPGYEGFYNFFNIGATHSTIAGGAIANGLTYAKNGTTNATTNALYMIPWNSPFKAIVGGSNFIGSSYINRGQNTVYLQKFNSTPVSTYSHQYMANVEAAKAEASKTFVAYSGMTSIPIVFRIPVYMNMPEQICVQPTQVLNPNNWLASLSVDGYVLTPTFRIEDLEGTGYNLIVPGNIEGVNVQASAVSTKASVVGTGYIPLTIGNNQVTITVTAENQNVRQYTINIVRDVNVQ